MKHYSMIHKFVFRTLSAGCVLAAAICLACAGCGEKTVVPDLVPVKGKVTYGGKAVPGAKIVFVPDDEDNKKKMKKPIERPHAETEADGSYELLWVDEPGAPVGKYSVTIIAYEKQEGEYDPEGAQKSLIPEIYANPKASKLTAVVKDGDNVIDFNLQ